MSRSRLPHNSRATLWVCWRRPRQAPPPGAVVLSFLMPSVEEAWRSEASHRVHSARELSTAVRGRARRTYLEVVTRLGLVPGADGRTFRAQLVRPGEASQWWYHPVAFRGCETDPTFDGIIAIHTIRSLAGQVGARRLVLVGAPPFLAAVLRGAYDIEELAPRRGEGAWTLWWRGIGSRLRLLIRTWRDIGAARRYGPAPDGLFDVMLAGFWDWSVRWNERSRELSDRYFKRLPGVLEERSIGRVGWCLWMDPGTDPNSPRRSRPELLRPLRGRTDVVMLQRWLSRLEVLNAAMDLAPLRAFLAMRRQPAYAAACEEEGLNYAPLFSARLLDGFLDASLPHRALVALAVSRACRRYQPSVSLHFLEHFPFSRAWYEGARRAQTRTVCCAVQHAGYSHEKTFLWLDPEREWRGEPDGCAVPHPDVICAMGTLGQELFHECGYPSDRVRLTGSPRYEHVSATASRPSRDSRGTLTVLLALGLAPELDMVDAACAAARGLDGVRILVRNHPFSRIEQRPGFGAYQARVAVTDGSLADDLAQADVVLFTYSTVAEEAWLLGIPVWQWLPVGFNGSALAEAADIPQCGTVQALRQALMRLREDPAAAVPHGSLREAVLERLFYRGDGLAAERIAEVLQPLRRGSTAVVPRTDEALPV